MFGFEVVKMTVVLSKQRLVFREAVRYLIGRDQGRQVKNYITLKRENSWGRAIA